MIQIEFRYKKGRRERLFSTKLPESMEELTPSQYLDVTKIVISGLPEQDAKILLVWKLCGINPKVFSMLSSNVVSQLVPHVQFCYGKSPRKISLIQKHLRYRGAENVLKNFTIGQWMTAQQYAYEFLNEKTEAALNRFNTAIWYRKKFDFRNSDKMQPKVASFPLSVRMATFSNYQALSAYLPHIYPHAFSGESGDTPMKPGAGIFKMIRECAGPKFGDIERTTGIELHVILDYVNDLMKNQAKGGKK